MTNLVINPGAESSLTTGWSGAVGDSSAGWGRNTNNAWVYNGSYSFYTTCTQNCPTMGQNISFIPGYTYKVSVFVLNVDAGITLSLKIDQAIMTP